MNNILKLSSMTMKFGGVVAIDNFSLEVNESEIVSIIGPNGAGKTTCFNCITGIYQPTSGDVEFCGKSILNTKPNKIVSMGISRTFQNIRLFKNLTVFENVLIAVHLRHADNIFTSTFRLNKQIEQDMINDANDLLASQDLLKYKDVVSQSLPYGLQRRLEIARALATKPKLLLLDEPAAGMNPQETKDLTDYIKHIKDKYNLSVLLIEHHMDLVMDISDRIYVLDFGKMIASGTTDQIQNDERVINAYLGVDDNA